MRDVGEIKRGIVQNMRHVLQVDVAYSCLPVPSKHRIDSFREFSRTGFVDATG